MLPATALPRGLQHPLATSEPIAQNLIHPALRHWATVTRCDKPTAAPCPVRVSILPALPVHPLRGLRPECVWDLSTAKQASGPASKLNQRWPAAAAGSGS